MGWIESYSWRAGLVAAGLALTVLGCRQPGQQAVSPEDRQSMQTTPSARTRIQVNAPTLLTEGAAPLYWSAAPGQNLRIVDLDTNEIVLRMNMAENAIVAIDSKAGILVGGEKRVPGPLPAGHRYQIWLEPRASR